MKRCRDWRINVRQKVIFGGKNMRVRWIMLCRWSLDTIKRQRDWYRRIPGLKMSWNKLQLIKSRILKILKVKSQLNHMKKQMRRSKRMLQTFNFTKINWENWGIFWSKEREKYKNYPLKYLEFDVMVQLKQAELLKTEKNWECKSLLLSSRALKSWRNSKRNLMGSKVSI